MTPNEFKAWFDGFCAAIGGAPSEEQFQIIKDQFAKISDPPVNKIPLDPRMLQNSNSSIWEKAMRRVEEDPPYRLDIFWQGIGEADDRCLTRQKTNAWAARILRLL